MELIIWGIIIILMWIFTFYLRNKIGVIISSLLFSLTNFFIMHTNKDTERIVFIVMIISVIIIFTGGSYKYETKSGERDWRYKDNPYEQTYSAKTKVFHGLILYNIIHLFQNRIE